MASVNAVTNPAASTQTDPSSSSATSSLNKLANQDTFLQLLVAQIKNQDPLNPTDGTAFLGQLAQFSQLEQLIGIHTDLQQLTAGAQNTGDTTTSK
jgi:flagellar basal-body rod modification protein FlgD